MKRSEIYLIDSEYSPSPTEDILIAIDLIKRNKDYSTLLEDALKLLEKAVYIKNKCNEIQKNEMNTTIPIPNENPKCNHSDLEQSEAFLDDCPICMRSEISALKKVVKRESQTVDSLDALLGAVTQLKLICDDMIDSKDERLIQCQHWMDRANDNIGILLHGEP